MIEPQRDSYYGRPIIKAPTWGRSIPGYFFLGGLAAGSSLLAAGADARGDRRLARMTRATALAAIAAGSVALVADLGRPTRLHHMLRVFRPSSPMSMGSWILTAYAPAAGIAALSDLIGVARPLGRVATWSAASLAPALATYTGVLTADTVVPAWHHAREELPAIFAAGAAASAGGVAAMLQPGASAARRYALAGAAAEVALAARMHRTLPADVERAYGDGLPRRLQTIATASAAAGAALTVAGRGRMRATTRVGGLLVTIGVACQRFAIYEAGKASAADPAATVGPQLAAQHQPA
jgi:Polysulphide reductase, NrfD